MPPTPPHTPQTARTVQETAVVREFRPPYSAKDVRVLQGRACIACHTMTDELRPAGTAVSVGPGGETLRWDVRQCARCVEEAAR